MITTEYLAGLIDGEGSFTCQLHIRDESKRTFQINARISLGFKQSPHETKLLYDIHEQFKIGKIYISNDGKENGKVSFYTTNLDDTITICNLLLPHLHLKQDQCRKLLHIVNIMKSKQHLRYVKGITTTSCDIYTKDELIEIVTIATTMNESRQTTKYRDTISRDTQHYIDSINRMYEV